MDTHPAMQKAIEYVTREIASFPKNVFFNNNFLHHPRSFEIYCIMSVDEKLFDNKMEWYWISKISRIKIQYEKICLSMGYTKYPYIGFRFVKL